MSGDYTVELDTEPGRDQTQESLTVRWADGRAETMRLHEYGRVYAIGGLYEEVVQERLRCLSPALLADRLVAAVAESGEDPAALAALDLGAGNGVVGSELRRAGAGGPLVASDTEPEAEPAAQRDRPGLYAEYAVSDLGALDVAGLIARHGLNCLTGAGALGIGHIPWDLFAATWAAFAPGAWLAVTASEEGDAAQRLASEPATQVVHSERFPHRLRMSGEPIFYRLIVARRAG